MITSDERRWVYGFAALALLLTSLPYLAGFSVQGEHWVFTGFVFGVEDGNSYIAKMLSGQAGAWLFCTPYTTQVQRGVLAFLPYLLLGKLTSPPDVHTQLTVLFHLYRLAAGFLEVLATYRFLSLFIKEVRTRRWGLSLAILGGGLGWVLVLLGQDQWLGSMPLDFYSPETFGFLGLYGLPHLALARALLLWGLADYLGPPLEKAPLVEPVESFKSSLPKPAADAQPEEKPPLVEPVETFKLSQSKPAAAAQPAEKPPLVEPVESFKSSLPKPAADAQPAEKPPLVEPVETFQLSQLKPGASGGAPQRPGETGNDRRAGLRAGLLWLALGLAQPATVVIAWAVLGMHLGTWALALLYKTRTGPGGEGWSAWRGYLCRAVTAGLVSAPIVLYTAAAFGSDPFLRAWTAQNIIRSPHPLHYLAAYGLLLVPAVIGARRLLGESPEGRAWLPVGWVLAIPLLAYAPVELQRRLPEGGWVAIVLLAILGLEALGRKPSAQLTVAAHSDLAVRSQPAAEKPARPARAFLPTLLLYPSTLILVMMGVLAALKPAAPVFRPAEEVAAFEALAAIASPGEGVVAAYDTGNALPAWAPVRVVIGHGPESAGLEQLRPQVDAFYAAATREEQRLARMEEWGVDYVFWGPNERRLGGWLPGSAWYLHLVYEQGDYAIYAAGVREGLIGLSAGAGGDR